MYECADCGATFEEATMISFAIITLGEADGADTVLEASAWDRMQDIATKFEGQVVLLKVTPRTDNPNAVSIDHIQALEV